MGSRLKAVDVEVLREHLDELLSSRDTVVITRDGEKVGYYQPACIHPTPEQIQAALEANAELRAMIERLDMSEDDVIPVRQKPDAKDFQALHEASAKLQKLMDSAGLTEDEVVNEFQAIRKREHRLVLDANILTRAALGRRVQPLLERYSDRWDFTTADVAVDEVSRILPLVLGQRGYSDTEIPTFVERTLGRLLLVVTAVAYERFQEQEIPARRRLARRDESDWPHLALALTLDCPLWTEDRDFFGTGISTWTSDLVEIYLESAV